MANRVFLTLAASDDPDVSYNADEIVAAANYMLPVLWCLASGDADIAWRSLTQEDITERADAYAERSPAVVAYPVLLIQSDAARQRSRERRGLFFRVFPRWLDQVYDEWLALLDGIGAPCLLVDTLELWVMFDEPDQFEWLLRECVSAFENHEPRYWTTLLEQASIDLDVSSGDLSFDVNAVPNLLRGYEWLRPVPWAE